MFSGCLWGPPPSWVGTARKVGTARRAVRTRTLRRTFHAELRAQLEALIGDERDAIANLANAAALIWHTTPDGNWAGFYLRRSEDELVLGLFHGKPACVRIAVGRGVCGTAVARDASVLVGTRAGGWGPGAAEAEATIDATTITTDNAKRDAHLKSPDFFDAAGFPTITFKSKRAEAVGKGKFKLIGDLTMRGKTKEVVLDVDGPTDPITAQNSQRIGATATTTINRQDYGVSWSRALDGGGVVVSDDVKITIELELITQTS